MNLLHDLECEREIEQAIQGWWNDQRKDWRTNFEDPEVRAKLLLELRDRIVSVVMRSLPTDEEISTIVGQIAYKQLAEEQAYDFVEKFWILKNFLTARNE